MGSAATFPRAVPNGCQARPAAAATTPPRNAGATAGKASTLAGRATAGTTPKLASRSGVTPA